MKTSVSKGRRWAAAAALLGACLVAPSARGERQEPLPPALDGVRITAKLDAQIPLNLDFNDEDGDPVTLAEFFEPGRPVLLTLGYYGCPMLCDLVLNGLIDALREIPWTPGDEFEIVTVSIDPVETPTLAKVKKQNYLSDYGRPGAASGWHFLTGTGEASTALADAVGFGYRYDDEREEYAHPAAVFVLTPDGRVSRYLSGIRPDPRTVRLSLVEASEGGVGSAIDQFFLTCFHYDAEAGRYAPAAVKIMRLGGALTVIALGAALAALWVREARRRRAAPGLR